MCGNQCWVHDGCGCGPPGCAWVHRAGRAGRRRGRWPGPVLLGTGVGPALALILALGAWPAAATEVYRCVSASGAIEFRQQPCRTIDQEERLQIEAQSSGWTPPTRDAPSRPATRRPTRPAGVEQARRGESDRCWRRQRALDDVNRRLRRGYSAAQGQRWRDRRADHEAYLWRFCR